ncbi:MAG: SGNH/GDSL hydrolase family protein [bacterium]|nr:SGNH/GDSL hydrolase family protein [bacterium]
MMRANWIVRIILIACLIEGSAYLGLQLLERLSGLKYKPMNELSERHAESLVSFLDGRTGSIRYSPTLGWTVAEDSENRRNQINSSGIRSRTDYSLSTPSNVLRVTTFGDSFTFGDEVKNEETWQAVIEHETTALEVLNFGVSGFGLDQTYLRYMKYGEQFDAQIVFIGFMSENIFRNVSRYRPFYFSETGLPFGKPRFTLTGEGISLLENPFPSKDEYLALLENPRKVLPQAGKNDYYYGQGYEVGPADWLATVRLIKMVYTQVKRSAFSDNILVDGTYNIGSEAFRVTHRIFDLFYSQVKQNSESPMILLFPAHIDVVNYRNTGTTRYSPLTSYFDSNAYAYIDLIGAFTDSDTVYDLDELYGKIHYSPFGNRLIADYIMQRLRSEFPEFSDELSVKSGEGSNALH